MIPTIPFLIHDGDGITFHFSLVRLAKDLGIKIDSSLKPTIQVNAAIANA